MYCESKLIESTKVYRVTLTDPRVFVCVLTGPRQDQDSEEGRSGRDWEVLHPTGQWLPHQQESVWGDRHHPQQTSAQQDRRVSKVQHFRCTDTDNMASMLSEGL